MTLCISIKSHKIDETRSLEIYRGGGKYSIELYDNETHHSKTLVPRDNYDYEELLEKFEEYKKLYKCDRYENKKELIIEKIEPDYQDYKLNIDYLKEKYDFEISWYRSSDLDRNVAKIGNIKRKKDKKILDVEQFKNDIAKLLNLRTYNTSVIFKIGHEYRDDEEYGLLTSASLNTIILRVNNKENFKL